MRVKDRPIRAFWVMGICALGLNFVRIPATFAVEEFTLDIAIQTALTLNPELKAIREKINVTQARLDGIALLSNPEIETEVVGGIPGGQKVELTKSFELGGQRGHRKRMTLTNIEKRNAEIAEASRLLTKSVKIAFCNLILIQEKLKLGKEVVQLSEQVAEIAQFQFEAGEISVTKLNLAKIQLQSVLRERSALESQLQLAQLELNSLMGTPLEQSLIAVGQLKSQPQKLNLDTLTADTLANRADLKSLRLDAQLIKSELKLARAANIPDLSVGAVAERGAGENLFGGKIGIQLPLFDRNHAEINAAKAQQGVNVAEISNQEREIVREVMVALLSLNAAQKALDFYEGELLNLLDENLELTRTAYQLGEAELLEVILTQNAFIDTRFAYLDALSTHRKALVELETVVGIPAN